MKYTARVRRVLNEIDWVAIAQTILWVDRNFEVSKSIHLINRRVSYLPFLSLTELLSLLILGIGQVIHLHCALRKARELRL